MAKAFEFHCPICGSLCQTTEDMRGKQLQCLMCMAKIMVPHALSDSEGLDIQYFLQKGVVKQKLKSAPDEPPSQ